ncbi:hypothetical protein CN288_17135 [Bacillus sp. AFS023182]|uniref:hypothetical protein n=1 Tax=Bacillus sp. AFS023182 TaxID=2033492 RepID=UPI000BF6B13F|nr:hypothetical protein [Bacillus sp. AFS023182]PFE01232.1 hypothetical protein CN288_17135 [Bacillus sp. AFS023182]
MDPGGWGWSEPLRKNVEKISSDDTSQINLEVGQKFGHELYAYRFEITKIEVLAEKPDYAESLYNTAHIFITTYIPKDSEESAIKIGDYEIKPKEINTGKWFLIEDSEG